MSKKLSIKTGLRRGEEKPVCVECNKKIPYKMALDNICNDCRFNIKMKGQRERLSDKQKASFDKQVTL